MGGEDEVESHTHTRCSAEMVVGSAAPQSFICSIAFGDKRTSWREELYRWALISFLRMRSKNVYPREGEESSKRRAPAFGSSWSADSHFWMSWIRPILGAGDFFLPQRTSQPYALPWPCSWQEKKRVSAPCGSPAAGLGWGPLAASTAHGCAEFQRVSSPSTSRPWLRFPCRLLDREGL